MQLYTRCTVHVCEHTWLKYLSIYVCAEHTVPLCFTNLFSKGKNFGKFSTFTLLSCKAVRFGRGRSVEEAGLVNIVDVFRLTSLNYWTRILFTFFNNCWIHTLAFSRNIFQSNIMALQEGFQPTTWYSQITDILLFCYLFSFTLTGIICFFFNRVTVVNHSRVFLSTISNFGCRFIRLKCPHSTS